MMDTRAQTSTAEAEAEADAGDCAHHWQIETPAGETSKGICKRCGASRAFANYSPGRTTTRTMKPPAKAASA